MEKLDTNVDASCSSLKVAKSCLLSQLPLVSTPKRKKAAAATGQL